MAYNVFTVVILLALILVARKTIKYVREALFKQENGCKSEKRIHQLDPIFGFDIGRIQVDAFKNNRILALAKSRYDKYGNTWSVSLMGERFYNTIETENIKTVLATNFKDFGLGGRQQTFSPLLGKGIFTAGSFPIHFSAFQY
jgi:hypothetical protein